MARTTISTSTPHPAPSPIAAMFAFEPGVVIPLLSKNDSLSVGTGSSGCDVVGVNAATYTVVACCSIVKIDVDSSEAEDTVSEGSWEGSNSATVTAGKNGRDRLDEPSSIPLAFDGSSVCGPKIGKVVASSPLPNVGFGTLRWIVNDLCVMSIFWVDSRIDVVCEGAKACASSTIQEDPVFPCGGSKVAVDCATAHCPGSM